MQTDHEMEKDIKFNQGMVEQWLKDAPKQVQEAFKAIQDRYEALRKQLGEQAESIAKKDTLVWGYSRELKMYKDKEQAKQLETSLMNLAGLPQEIPIAKTTYATDSDYHRAGWSYANGIPFGKFVVVMNERGEPMLRILVEPVTKDIEVDFDLFPLLVKRAQDGVLQKVLVDFSKPANY